MPEQRPHVAVITGASRGVGLAIAHRLAALGYDLALCARSQADLDAAAAPLAQPGRTVTTHVCDVSEEAQVDALREAVMQKHTHCDVLVNNAGVAQGRGPLHQVPPVEFDTTLATNVRGPYLMLRAFAPAMVAVGTGHIINIGSLAGKNPLANSASYAASKWALLGLMLSAAEELRPHGVRVSVISPGSIQTNFGGAATPNDQWKIAPEDIAEVVASLVQQSDRSFISEVMVRPLRKPAT